MSATQSIVETEKKKRKKKPIENESDESEKESPETSKKKKNSTKKATNSPKKTAICLDWSEEARLLELIKSKDSYQDAFDAAVVDPGFRESIRNKMNELEDGENWVRRRLTSLKTSFPPPKFTENENENEKNEKNKGENGEKNQENNKNNEENKDPEKNNQNFQESIDEKRKRYEKEKVDNFKASLKKNNKKGDKEKTEYENWKKKEETALDTIYGLLNDVSELEVLASMRKKNTPDEAGVQIEKEKSHRANIRAENLRTKAKPFELLSNVMTNNNEQIKGVGDSFASLAESEKKKNEAKILYFGEKTKESRLKQELLAMKIEKMRQNNKK